MPCCTQLYFVTRAIKVRGTFNKFQDCSSYEAPSEY